MPINRQLWWPLAFGALLSTCSLLVSFTLYALGQGREMMEPPYNLVATILQMPGLLVSDFFAQKFAIYSPWFHWGIAFGVQCVIWSIIAFLYRAWRVRGF